jgi:hypothetical protein
LDQGQEDIAMSRQTCLLLVSVAAGIIAGHFSRYLEIKGTVDKAPVILSIVIAALFVRLARGTPPFPFEKLEVSTSNRILASFEHLRRLYSHAFLALGISVIASIIYSTSIDRVVSQIISDILSGFIVFLLCWSLSLAYSIYSTDVKLFKAHTEAMQSVVDDIAVKEAEATAKAVKRSFE